MFDLRVGNKSLVLPPDFNVDFEFNHPFDSKDDIPGSYTINWSLPHDPINEVIFQHVMCVEVLSGAKSYDAVLWFKGSPHLTGKLIVIEGDRDEETGATTVDFIVNGFSVEILNKKLSEVDYGPEIDLGPDTDTIIASAKTASLSGYPDYPYTFPMIANSDFYGSDNSAFDGVLNGYDPIAEAYIKNDSGDNVNVLVPQINMKYILDCIFSGYEISGSFFEISGAKKIFVYNNHALDKKVPNKYHARVSQSTPWTSPLIFPVWLPLDDETTVPNEDPDNAWDNVAYEYEVQTTGPHRADAFISVFTNDVTYPIKQCRYLIIMGLGTPLNATQVYNNFPDNEWVPIEILGYRDMLGPDVGEKIRISVQVQGKMLVTDPGWTDIDTQVKDSWLDIKNIHASDHNVFSGTLNCSNHVPDMEVGEFIASLKKAGLCFQVFPFSRKVKIDYIDETFTAPYIEDIRVTTNLRKTLSKETGFTFKYPFSEDEIGELPDITAFNLVDEVTNLADIPPPAQVNDIVYVQNMNVYYITVTNIDNDALEWKFLCHNFFPYILGDGATEMEMEFTPLLMTDMDFGGLNILIPIFNETGSSDHFAIGKNAPAFKLGIYQGFHPSSTGDLYPFASSFNLDRDGSQIGSLTLRMDDTNESIFKKTQYNWMRNLITAPRITRYMEVDEPFLANLDFIKRLKIGNSFYALCKMNTIYHHEKIEDAEVELLKLN